MAGAPSAGNLAELLVKAGFEAVKIAMKDESAEFIKQWMPDAEKYVVAADVTARKPQVAKVAMAGAVASSASGLCSALVDTLHDISTNLKKVVSSWLSSVPPSKTTTNAKAASGRLVGASENLSSSPGVDDDTMTMDHTWILSSMRSVSPEVFDAYEPLLKQCALIVPKWRERFCNPQSPAHNKTLWLKLMKRENSTGSNREQVPKMFKEVVECAPVLQAAIDTIQNLPDKQRATVVDLACGKGFLSMFLSEMLPPAKCVGILLADKGWPLKGEEIKQHHISPAHIYGTGCYDSWPIPLDIWRRDLKQIREIKAIARRLEERANTEGPTIILGVHLCGLLSIRAVELFNMLGRDAARLMVLKPCCLPPAPNRQEQERVFELGNHTFPMSDVAGEGGRWKKNVWVGPPRTHLRAKFGTWCDHLEKGIVADDISRATENLQTGGGFQNVYLFARNNNKEAAVAAAV